MTTLGFMLVLAAAFCHATWNFFVKRINAGPELVWLFSLVTVVLYAPLAIWFAINSEPIDLLGYAFIIGSAIIHIGYFLLLQTGYRHGDLSVVYPTARATGPLLSFIFAILLLGETTSLQSGIGGVIIIFGVFMLAGGLKLSSSEAGKSLLFGVSAGILIGTYTIWDAYAVSTLFLSPVILDYCSSLTRSILLTPLAFKRRSGVKRLWAEHKVPVIVIALFNPLAYILVLVAMTFTPVTYVAPLREVSVVLSVLLGSLVLGEGNLRHRLLWSLVILTGVSVLTTA